MADAVTKVELVQAILKQMEVTTALFNVIEVDRTNFADISKARRAYFDAQQDLLNLTKEIWS